jgi:hypothetical protein
MAGDEAPDRTYGGWQPERVAFMFGLSARRAAILAAAILAVLFPVVAARMEEALVCWPAAVVLALAAMVWIQGRTGDEWLASSTSYGMIRVQGQHRFGGGPYTPPPPPGSHARDGDGPLMELPGILAPLRILSVPDPHHPGPARSPGRFSLR